MAAFERVLDGIRQVLLATEDVKRLTENVKALDAEVRDIDRRVACFVVGQGSSGGNGTAQTHHEEGRVTFVPSPKCAVASASVS